MMRQFPETWLSDFSNNKQWAFIAIFAVTTGVYLPRSTSQVAHEPPFLHAQKGCGYTRSRNSILTHAPLVALCGKQDVKTPHLVLICA